MNIQELVFDGSKILDYLPEGKNVSKLAKEVGITRQAMHDIVKGRRKPSADVTVKITASLNVSLMQLSKKFSSSVS